MDFPIHHCLVCQETVISGGRPQKHFLASRGRVRKLFLLQEEGVEKICSLFSCFKRKGQKTCRITSVPLADLPSEGFRKTKALGLAAVAAHQGSSAPLASRQPTVPSRLLLLRSKRLLVWPCARFPGRSTTHPSTTGLTAAGRNGANQKARNCSLYLKTDHVGWTMDP